MNNHELQKLRDLPIEGVAERLGLQVVRHKALCPFHDDHHASMSFCVRRNTYRCFACGAHGGTIDLAMHLLGKPFLDACRWLAEGVYLPCSIPERERESQQKERPFDASRYARYFEHPWLNDAARKFLFEERRLDPRVVRWCRLSSWQDRKGVAWLQIPYYSQDGRLIGIQNRNLVRGALPRFRFPQGSECGIYNLPVLGRLRSGDELWIAEGPSDCWALLSSGRQAIAIPSATLLSKKDKELLSSLNSTPSVLPSLREGLGTSLSFHMCPDNDAPGCRLFNELQKVLPTLQHHQLPAGCKDFSEYYLANPSPPSPPHPAKTAHIERKKGTY